jgi:nitrogen fixation NifU-like protein
MTDLRELYQEVIIDHSRHPRNFHDMPNATHHAEGFNRLCGDRLTLYLQVKDKVIQEISFKGTGCAISMASASLLSEQLKGKTVSEAETLFQNFHQLVTAATPSTTTNNSLGKLTVLGGVRDYPARVKCATLAWHTLHAALAHEQQPVSTEEPQF